LSLAPCGCGLRYGVVACGTAVVACKSWSSKSWTCLFLIVGVYRARESGVFRFPDWDLGTCRLLHLPPVMLAPCWSPFLHSFPFSCLFPCSRPLLAPLLCFFLPPLFPLTLEGNHGSCGHVENRGGPPISLARFQFRFPYARLLSRNFYNCDNLSDFRVW
jgi:hypothetical protein